MELKCVRSTFQNQTFDFRINQGGEVPHFSQLKGMCITSRTKKYGTVPFSKGQSLFWFKSTLPESVSISNLHDRDERKTRPISSTIREIPLSCHRLSSKKKWQEKQHRIYKRMTWSGKRTAIGVCSPHCIDRPHLAWFLPIRLHLFQEKT